MGRFYVTETLIAMAAEPATQVAPDELEPIRPGAWAAWAKAGREQDAAATPMSTVHDADPSPSPAPGALAPSPFQG
jgi:hypothetical protein